MSDGFILGDERHPRGFFLVERERMIRGLLNLRTWLCGYGARGMCDCKYGIVEKSRSSGPLPTTEQVGCPEILAAATILSVMTDEELEAFAKRAGCFTT